MSFAPYESSKAMMCKQERVVDCSYGVMNGKMMAYQLENPTEPKMLVDPNILVFDSVDVYPQSICNELVLQRGNNNTSYRRVDETCYGKACFIKTTANLENSQQTRAFDNNTKSKFRDAYPRCV